MTARAIRPADLHKEFGRMALFESTLTLVLVAIFLLQISRSLTIPYPTLLALAGVIVAALPWTPDIAIDPPLALALFIAPALLNAAYDFPPRALRTYWLPLLALAGMAVLLTTAAVAWAGVAIAGLPLAAAIALGAIVAPPDAAAASAMLRYFPLPRRTTRVLEGESLFNDAVALLIFVGAVGAVSTQSMSGLATQLALAVPGGILLGIVIGRVRLMLYSHMVGTLRGTLFEFVTTFGVWVIAERLHLSAVLAVVAFAMTVARTMPALQTARDRVHSYAVWDAAGFLLNVLAFLLLGLQARTIVERLGPREIWSALGFALTVLGIVIVVRLVGVLVYNRATAAITAWRGLPPSPSLAAGLVVSWSGMRGLVTLATALGLPAGFPGRDLIVLTGLTVVLGTLILQGLTLGPLIRYLRFQADDSFGREVSALRVSLIDTGIDTLSQRQDKAAAALRKQFADEREIAGNGDHPHDVAEINRLRREVLVAKRRKLLAMRAAGEIDDDVFHAVEEELDWAELATLPPDRLEIVEG